MKVTVQQRLIHEGKHVEPGEIIELDDKVVEALGDAVEPLKVTKKKDIDTNKSDAGGNKSSDNPEDKGDPS